jgi:DNA replication and repair protein RecF
LRIKTLKISNLRNIHEITLDALEGYNLVTGNNGAGKTTILESVVLLAKGRSFRSGQITSLIGPESSVFRVVADLVLDNGNTVRLGLERDVDGFKARLDGRDVTQISELARLLPHVLVEPNSHLLVSGSPEGRRKFLDWGVFHVEPAYLDLFRRYSRALKQRNAALRTSKRDVVTSMDPLLIELGLEIDQKRKDLVDKLLPVIEERLVSLDGRLRDVSIEYQQGWREGSLQQALTDSLQRDLDRGNTGTGPHRADLRFVKKGVSVRDQFSRGEQKALATALLLAQAELLTLNDEKPLLLLDDIASEFDDVFLSRIVSAGIEMGLQTWITDVSPASVMRHEPGLLRRFHVKRGKLESTQDNSEARGSIA